MNTDGKKILVVDDNQFFLHAFSEAIHKFCGFQGEVKEVSAGYRAIDEAKSRFYDLCFLDVNLPDMNGIDLMRRINAISPATRIAIMTASYIPEDLKKSIEEEASLFVEKPLDLHQIKDFLNHEVGIVRATHTEPKRTGQVSFSERRLEERSTADNTFHYSVQLPSVKEHKGQIVNVCDGGQCIMTDSHHEPGLMIRFNHAGEKRAGVVKWSVLDKDTMMYRTGIKFIESGT
jgi:CheY-like chemotaxis protein